MPNDRMQDLPHHERIEDPLFRRAADLLDAGDAKALRDHLSAHPGLVTKRVRFEGNYFTEPTLLEFVAENPIRHERPPPNIVEVAKIILDAGAELESINATLVLVCSGRVVRECGHQVPLIELLCAHGADPDRAILPALGHGEFEAAKALIRLGATIDLTVAAATGRLDIAKDCLPAATPEERHRALALSAQHGHATILALLLEAGEDPDRFNPPGCHAHSTALHQAALAGHLEVVKTLVEGGAKLDIRDPSFGATPLGWAQHDGQEEVAAYLRKQDES